MKEGFCEGDERCGEEGKCMIWQQYQKIEQEVRQGVLPREIADDMESTFLPRAKRVRCPWFPLVNPNQTPPNT